MTFTIEEMILITCFRHDSRQSVIRDISDHLQDIVDTDLWDACRLLRRKLTAISDADYRSLDLTLYDAVQMYV